uniref:hypothetical protein n=1 Tax=Pseudomonas laurentiana TaxID=2364649 RepID=UPI0029C90C12|nr:hypothetical protein [Pseudomonas laurentiana]
MSGFFVGYQNASIVVQLFGAGFLMVILEQAGQFLSTGLSALVLVGALQFGKLLFDIENKWILMAPWVGVALLIVFPHGWDLLFGSQTTTWEALMNSRTQEASSSQLFQADFWGAGIGAVIGYLGVQFIKPSGRY